jgi:2-methylisocitrate lyase-like PEP mutase family enzyme
MRINKTESLAERIRRRDFTVAPGVFDMISARIADSLGFDALYMTGYGVTASYLGLPDAGLATYTDMQGRAAAIAAGTSTPLIADADTGYGGLLNVRHTVRGYEAAGIAAIQIEDQEYPKKCGHTPDRRVISAADMVRKIKVAVESRSSADFMIIARTDARTALGLDEALRRGEAYAKAGADIVFIESPESEAELERIGRSFDTPLLANMVEGGRTPILPPARLKALGFTIALYPAAGFLAAGAALRGVYGDLRDKGTSHGTSVPLESFAAFSKLMGFEDVWAFERRWAETAPAADPS